MRPEGAPDPLSSPAASRVFQGKKEAAMNVAALFDEAEKKKDDASGSAKGKKGGCCPGSSCDGGECGPDCGPDCDCPPGCC